MREWKIAPHYPLKAKGRTLSGLFSTFGVRDSVDDVVQPQAFDATIQLRGGKILYLWGHDFQAKPTALIRNIYTVPRKALPEEILRDYPQATGGAVVEREYFLHEEAEAAFEVARSAPIGLSYGYDPLGYKFVSARDGVQERYLTEIRLHEVSDVNFPALSAVIANMNAKGYKFAGGMGLYTRKHVPSMDLLRAKWRLMQLDGTSRAGRTPSMAELGLRLRAIELGML